MKAILLKPKTVSLALYSQSTNHSMTHAQILHRLYIPDQKIAILWYGNTVWCKHMEQLVWTRDEVQATILLDQNFYEKVLDCIRQQDELLLAAENLEVETLSVLKSN